MNSRLGLGAYYKGERVKIAIIAACIVPLAGCATARQTYTPDGKVGHSINCSGSALNWGMCYEKAGETVRRQRVYGRRRRLRSGTGHVRHAVWLVQHVHEQPVDGYRVQGLAHRGSAQMPSQKKIAMKKFLAAAVLAGLASTAFADEYVNGHYRSDGTYVQPHHRSSPNDNEFDNYNAKGNVNPYTGKQGNQPHELSEPYQPPKAYRPRKN